MGWGYGWWNDCGWLEFMRWRRSMNRLKQGEQPTPDSWRGRENDPFWQEMDERRQQMRGR